MSLDVSTHQVNTIQGRIQEARRRLAALNTSLGIEPTEDRRDTTATSQRSVVLSQSSVVLPHVTELPAAQPLPVPPPSAVAPISRSVSFVSVSQASTVSSRPLSPVRPAPPPQVFEDDRSPSIEAVHMSPLPASPPPPKDENSSVPSSPSASSRLERFRVEREAARGQPSHSRLADGHSSLAGVAASPSRAPSMSLDEMQDQLRRRIQRMQSSRSTSNGVSEGDTQSSTSDVAHDTSDKNITAPVPIPARKVKRPAMSPTIQTSLRPSTPTPSQRASRDASSRSVSRASSNSRLPTSPPRQRAELRPSSEHQDEGAGRTVRAALSGAEVFAVLRLRGTITSSGDTGERLLPPTRNHILQLTEEEHSQLRQLRLSLARQQQRN